MNTDYLSLPKVGVYQARHIDDMREMVFYDVSSNGLHASWDTMIGGAKHTVHLRSFNDERQEKFLERVEKTRSEVHAFFRGVEALNHG